MVLDTLEMVRSRTGGLSQLQPKTPREFWRRSARSKKTSHAVIPTSLPWPKTCKRRYTIPGVLEPGRRAPGAGAQLKGRIVEAAAVALLLLDRGGRLGDRGREAKQKVPTPWPKRKQAVKAARAANEQNRNAVEADVELIVLVTQTLRDVPAIQEVREKILDKTMARLSVTAKAMNDLRRAVDWDPKNEETNWRSLAWAYQARALVSLSRTKFAGCNGAIPAGRGNYRQARRGTPTCPSRSIF